MTEAGPEAKPCRYRLGPNSSVPARSGSPARAGSSALRVGAVAMRLALAPAAYRGVGLKVTERAEGVAYEICLTHRDSDFDAVLARCADSDEAIA
ncbi:MAG TPA: hypothetical protein PKU97_14470, partial [Kofleriaceae bacterium]|nr:hypothetical protein [Kofleriaceae bacterium]